VDHHLRSNPLQETPLSVFGVVVTVDGVIVAVVVESVDIEINRISYLLKKLIALKCKIQKLDNGQDNNAALYNTIYTKYLYL